MTGEAAIIAQSGLHRPAQDALDRINNRQARGHRAIQRVQSPMICNSEANRIENFDPQTKLLWGEVPDLQKCPDRLVLEETDQNARNDSLLA
jgi:hypothetical protein